VKKLFWLDMEMTGLEVEKEVIIEVAAIVTDLNFRELAEYHSIVKQPQKYLDNMDEWNSKTHKESGLVRKVPFGKPEDLVESELIGLIHDHYEAQDDPVVLAGNSISQDRLFIEKYLPSFSNLLHYRMLDVTSWKIIMKNIYGLSYDKQNSHRALDDIRESISELKFYLGHLNLTPVTSDLV